MKILIIDDDKFNLSIAKGIILESDINAEIILCSNPFQAMEIINNDIDIILLDIVMPEMDGLQLLEQIRQKKELNDVQIIMLTSLTNKEKIKMCFELGADDYINKPIEQVEFIARLKAAIKKRENALSLLRINKRISSQNQRLKEMALKLKETQMHMIQKGTLISMGELAAGVAHEINNPIGYVGSNLDTLGNFIEKIKNVLEAYRQLFKMLEQENLTEKTMIEKKEIGLLEKKLKIDFVIDELENITNDSKEGINRVSKIVQTLRTYARTGYEENMFYNDLNTIIDESLLMVHNEAKYSTDIISEYGQIPEVICNRLQIGQVLLNILINAVQAIKSKKSEVRGKITVRTYTEGDFVVCSISDDGPGIKKEYLNRVFDPFFTTKEVGEGTGLGLSISHDIIVNKHKGDFYVKSEEGKGATFIIKLSLNAPD